MRLISQWKILTIAILIPLLLRAILSVIEKVLLKIFLEENEELNIQK